MTYNHVPLNTYAFLACKSFVEDLYIPPTVTLIKEGAFQSISDLKKVRYKAGITVETDAFDPGINIITYP